MLKYVVFSGSQEWRTAHSPFVGRVWWDLDPAIRATETPERLDKAQTVGGRLAPHLYPRPFTTHVFRVRTENNTKAQLGTFGILEPRWTIKYRVSNGTARRIEQWSKGLDRNLNCLPLSTQGADLDNWRLAACGISALGVL